MSEELTITKSPEYLQVEKVLDGVALQNHFENHNPFKMNLDREKMFAIQHIQKNPQLLKCTPNSFYNALVNVTATGLTLNPMMQQAHLVPRKNKGQMEVCLDPDYKGLVSIMINSGIAKDVFAHVVYENDLFEYDATSESVIKYVPYWIRTDQKFKEPGEEICTFCCVVNPDGTRKYRVVPIHRVNEIMEGTEAYKSYVRKKNKGEWATTMWQGDTRPDMVKKTAIRQMWKFVPKTDDMMFHALATAIEQHDIANENIENEQTIVNANGKDVKITANTDLSDSLKNSIKKPVPRKKKIEDAEIDDSKNEKYDKDALKDTIILIADNLNIDVSKGEQRSAEEAGEVKALLIGIGVDEQDINAWLKAKKARNQSLDELVRTSDSDQINMAMIAYYDN